MAPNDDLDPARVRDGGQIAADITAMEEFAARLLADVARDYAPHADTLANRMLARLPAADAGFGELVTFVNALESAQETCQQNIYNFANGTHGFAKAAEQVSQQYTGTDAFARARLGDIESALVTAGLLPPTPRPSGSPSEPSPSGADSPIDTTPAADASTSPSTESAPFIPSGPSAQEGS
ncbi:hypothetical protein [Actinoplanes teichomyceticus]|uniref:PE family protein n=1 Tax=Actinoplanes teichomyceticus TaxID=1867 RepID=A0A561WPL3_ACTTI|nr:hypothetical protein [Actinoplanes teichomyceticus]TWG25795.1 hypothetical protein FHX34_101767 [Actinoplanes teichomyceticus]GIF10871.1 hypothetical protein Ate01nite_09030 [Actinoplanes teichomyceticus]